MALVIREADRSEYPRIEALVIDSFGPITWARRLDERFGPLHGLDWRARWQLRMRKILSEQMILVGEAEGALAAVATGTLDRETKLAYIDLLAVERGRQRSGYGREMLRGAIAHFGRL